MDAGGQQEDFRPRRLSDWVKKYDSVLSSTFSLVRPLSSFLSFLFGSRLRLRLKHSVSAILPSDASPLLGGGLAVFMFLAFIALNARAAQTDMLLEEKDLVPRAIDLAAPARLKAEAMALYAKAIFAEDSYGLEGAIASYRKSFELDPTNTVLAVRLAQEYLQRGETLSAIGILKDNAKAQPKDYLAPLVLSDIYLRYLRKPGLAEEYAQRALRLAPQQFECYEMLWEIYQFDGQSAKAMQILDRAERGTAKNPDYWLELAVVYRKQFPSQQPTREVGVKIERALQRALELGEGRLSVISKVAEFYMIDENVDRAVKLYEKLYEVDPDYPGALGSLAACYVKTHQYEKAKPLLLQIFAQHPQDLLVCDQLADIYLTERNVEKALEYRQKALVLQPYQPTRYLDVIDLLLSLQRYELAMFYLEDARSRFPQTGLFTFLQGVTLTRLERSKEALPLFEQALVELTTSIDQSISADFYFEYGVAAESSGDYVLAADCFRKAIDLDPANAARACNYLGYMLVEQGQHLKEAEQLIKRALEVDPENGSYLDSLGWLYYKQGKYSEALVELLRAVKLLPQPDPVIFNHIGDVYSRLGRMSDAISYWKKAMRLDPNNTELQVKIDRGADAIVKQPVVGQ